MVRNIESNYHPLPIEKITQKTPESFTTHRDNFSQPLPIDRQSPTAEKNNLFQKLLDQEVAKLDEKEKTKNKN